jgi:hypothetical protein
MATNFPTSLDTLTNPLATDTLDSPPHDTQHADANDAIEALQAKVGVNSSAVATSHDYKIGALETDVSAAQTDITNINELQLNQQVGTTYTLVLADSGKLVEMNNASANTLTVPPNSSVAFPVGSQILVLQTGAGQTTLAAGAGVTVNSKDGNLKLSAQWCAATLIKRATDVWVVVGDLSA